MIGNISKSKALKGDKGDPGVALTDQTYNSESENAQSGKAVREALNNFKLNLQNYEINDIDNTEIPGIYYSADDPDNGFLIVNRKASEFDIGNTPTVWKITQIYFDINGYRMSRQKYTNKDTWDDWVHETNLLFGTFATKEELLAYDDVTAELRTRIVSIEDDIHPIPEVVIPTTLVANKYYNFGEQTELTLAFPSTAQDGDVIYLTFESGATATTLTIDTTYTSDIEVIPEANTGYEIFGKYNGKIWIVNYSEYTVTEEA